MRVAGFEPDTIGVRSQRNFHAALGSTRLKNRSEVRIELTLVNHTGFETAPYYTLRPIIYKCKEIFSTLQKRINLDCIVVYGHTISSIIIVVKIFLISQSHLFYDISTINVSNRILRCCKKGQVVLLTSVQYIVYPIISAPNQILFGKCLYRTIFNDSRVFVCEHLTSNIVNHKRTCSDELIV